MARPTRVAASLNPDINGLLEGSKWVGTVSYSFPDSRFDYEIIYPLPQLGVPLLSSNFRRAHPYQEEVVHHALKGFWAGSEVTNPGSINVLRTTSVEQFTELEFTYAGHNSSDVRIAQSTRVEGRDHAGEAYPPGAKTFGVGDYGGDVWFKVDRAADPTLGDFNYQTILHEVGHALGLKHGHEGGGPGRTAVSGARDSSEFTVMTYRDFVGEDLKAGSNPETYGHPQSFMMLDIAALQYLYGANFEYNSGDTRYQWRPGEGVTYINGMGQGVPGANKIFLTIWDGNGNDTYDFSRYTEPVSISLEPGGWSTTALNQRAILGRDLAPGPGSAPPTGEQQLARGNVFNALQFNDDARSLIENAIAGSGNDVIRGNRADNRLIGGGGDDTLDGGDGIDTLRGGSNDDRLFGGADNDAAFIGPRGGLFGEEGNDQLDGGDGDDDLFGGPDDDVLQGGDGNDRLEGNDGVDVLLGGSGDDNEFVFADAGLFGGEGNDRLFGEAGSDSLDGGTGEDGLDGGEGHDRLFGGDGNDSFFAGTPEQRFGLRGGQGDDELFGGAGDDSLEGGADGDALSGGSGEDVLNGDQGNDRLEGGTAGDLFIFGQSQGNDTILDFEKGSDRIGLRSFFSNPGDSASPLLQFGDLDTNGNQVLDDNDFNIAVDPTGDTEINLTPFARDGGSSVLTVLGLASNQQLDVFDISA
jgi:serralysin